MANTIRPVFALRLSWRINQIKNATSGSTKTAQKMKDGMFISSWLIVDGSWLMAHGS
jgi:hypothetical protein